MESLDKRQMLSMASEVAKAAGDRLRGISGRRVKSDAGNDVKLKEDVESEGFIRGLLEKSGLPVIGEEGGGDINAVFGDALYWIVDPIDGTYNFLRGIPGVCVSVALMRGLTPVVGAIYDFTHAELFAGCKDLGLFLNGSRVSPAWARDVSQAVLMTGFPSATDYSDESLGRFVMAAQKFKKVRMCGSACAALAWVAAGRADAYAENRLYLWDVAAGLSLIEGAGGVFKMEMLGLKDKPLCLSVQAAAKEEYFI